jgi:hypothetical protein
MSRVPSPAVMPVEVEDWRKRLDLSTFVNAYYQYRDLQRFDDCREVLVVGPGQGLVPDVLRARGYAVTTFDIDARLGPDHLGSVHDLGVFPDDRFDAVIVSHVLEHLAVPYLDGALSEIARVGRAALIYLPVAGRHVSLRVTPGVANIDVSLVVDLFNYFHRPDGVTPRFMAAQHFWEIGRRGFSVVSVRRRLAKHFEIVDAYRNRDWLPSYNFVLRARRGDDSE